MKCCFIGYKEEFGSKKECKTIENIILKSKDGESFTHPLVTVDKKAKTPTAYPRPYAKISKKPL